MTNHKGRPMDETTAILNGKNRITNCQRCRARRQDSPPVARSFGDAQEIRQLPHVSVIAKTFCCCKTFLRLPEVLAVAKRVGGCQKFWRLPKV